MITYWLASPGLPVSLLKLIDLLIFWNNINKCQPNAYLIMFVCVESNFSASSAHFPNEQFKTCLTLREIIEVC